MAVRAIVSLERSSRFNVWMFVLSERLAVLGVCFVATSWCEGCILWMRASLIVRLRATACITSLTLSELDIKEVRGQQSFCCERTIITGDYNQNIYNNFIFLLTH